MHTDDGALFWVWLIPINRSHECWIGSNWECGSSFQFHIFFIVSRLVFVRRRGNGSAWLRFVLLVINGISQSAASLHINSARDINSSSTETCSALLDGGNSPFDCELTIAADQYEADLRVVMSRIRHWELRHHWNVMSQRRIRTHHPHINVWLKYVF